MRFRGTESQMKNRRSISDIILKDSEFSGILLTNQDNSSKFIQEEKYILNLQVGGSACLFYKTEKNIIINGFYVIGLALSAGHCSDRIPELIKIQDLFNCGFEKNMI